MSRAGGRADRLWEARGRETTVPGAEHRHLGPPGRSPLHSALGVGGAKEPDENRGAGNGSGREEHPGEALLVMRVVTVAVPTPARLAVGGLAVPRLAVPRLG